MASNFSGNLWSEEHKKSFSLARTYDLPFKIVRATVKSSYIWGHGMSFESPSCHAYLECKLWFENISAQTIRGDVFIEYKTIAPDLETKIIEEPSDYLSIRRAIIDPGDEHELKAKLNIASSGAYKLEFRSICVDNEVYKIPFDINLDFVRKKRTALFSNRKHTMEYQVKIIECGELISEWSATL